MVDKEEVRELIKSLKNEYGITGTVGSPIVTDGAPTSDTEEEEKVPEPPRPEQEQGGAPARQRPQSSKEKKWLLMRALNKLRNKKEEMQRNQGNAEIYQKSPQNVYRSKQKPRDQHGRPYDFPPYRQGRSKRGISDVGITVEPMFGNRPILGGHRYGIFDSNRSFVQGGVRITDRPVLNGGPPVVGNRGTAVSQGQPITGSSIIAELTGRRR